MSRVSSGKIGVRREDKHAWERRVPLTPAVVADLVERAGLEFVVQPSTIRAFGDDAYRSAGAAVDEDLGDCAVVFAVKEIPESLFRKGGAYVFFSHTIKGQPHNMPMLRRLMELGCTLIDYERIVDDQGRRLVFFGRHAGLAGLPAPVERAVILWRGELTDAYRDLAAHLPSSGRTSDTDP